MRHNAERLELNGVPKCIRIVSANADLDACSPAGERLRGLCGLLVSQLHDGASQVQKMACSALATCLHDLLSSGYEVRPLTTDTVSSPGTCARMLLQKFTLSILAHGLVQTKKCRVAIAIHRPLISTEWRRSVRVIVLSIGVWSKSARVLCTQGCSYMGEALIVIDELVSLLKVCMSLSGKLPGGASAIMVHALHGSRGLWQAHAPLILPIAQQFCPAGGVLLAGADRDPRSPGQGRLDVCVSCRIARCW
jgi:hypothetical protein